MRLPRYTAEQLAAIGQPASRTKSRPAPALPTESLAQLGAVVDRIAPGMNLGASLARDLPAPMGAPSTAPGVTSPSGRTVYVRAHCAEAPSPKQRTNVTFIEWATYRTGELVNGDDVWDAATGLEDAIFAGVGAEANIILGYDAGDTAAHTAGTTDASRAYKKEVARNMAISFIKPRVLILCPDVLDPSHIEMIRDLVMANLGLTLAHGHRETDIAMYGERFETIEGGMFLTDNPDLYRVSLINNKNWRLKLDGAARTNTSLAHLNKQQLLINHLYTAGNPLQISFSVGLEVVFDPYDIYVERCKGFGFKDLEILPKSQT